MSRPAPLVEIDVTSDESPDRRVTAAAAAKRKQEDRERELDRDKPVSRVKSEAGLPKQHFSLYFSLFVHLSFFTSYLRPVSKSDPRIYGQGRIHKESFSACSLSLNW